MNAGIQTCPQCGEPMKYMGASMTLVGYYSEAPHNHDDNCLTAQYECPSGHTIGIHHQRKCPVEDCEWIGKATCWCHKGAKVGIWVNDRKPINIR